MKKLFVVFVGSFIALGTANAAILDKNATINMIDKKQPILNESDFKVSGSGTVVSGVSANNGVITVQKSEVTIPVGGQTSSSHAAIWVQ